MERVIPYADRAAELERVDACVANDLRMIAVQIGLPLAKDAASKKYVAAMLDRLERDKPALAAVGAADRAARAQALALDLYRRALGADKPELSPHPRLPWCVTHAPRVAQCFHACAVALDAMRLHVEPLPEQLRKIQAASHARSQQLSAQLARALDMETPVVSVAWRPLDVGVLPARQLTAAAPAPVAVAPAPAPEPEPKPANNDDESGLSPEELYMKRESEAKARIEELNSKIKDMLG